MNGVGCMTRGAGDVVSNSFPVFQYQLTTMAGDRTPLDTILRLEQRMRVLRGESHAENGLWVIPFLGRLPLPKKNVWAC